MRQTALNSKSIQKITSKAVGGTKRRSAILDIETGNVTYTEDDRKVTWKEVKGLISAETIRLAGKYL